MTDWKLKQKQNKRKTYNMSGGLFVRRKDIYVYIEDKNSEQTIILYLPQGDCQNLIDILVDIQKNFDTEERTIEDINRLRSWTKGLAIREGAT